MADVKIPCESCIHNNVCNAKIYFEKTKVEATHPYVKVTLECTEFYARPHQREIEDPLNDRLYRSR